MPRACLLCRAKPATRPRGLCRVCYYRRRDETTVSDSPHARRGITRGTGRRPAGPTPHPPGSAGKVAAMAARAARGESLFHPDDAGPGSTEGVSDGAV